MLYARLLVECEHTMSHHEGLLYLNPLKPKSDEPVIDKITRRMASAFSNALPTRPVWRGWHTCVCGARSSNRDYELVDGTETNSLCVHYLAYHRDEVPPGELARVMLLPADEVEPTEAMLEGR